MIYRNDTDRSVPQRVLLQVLQTALLALGGWLLCRGTGNEARRIILFVCLAVTYARFIATMLVFVRRPIGWGEALSIPVALALCFVGFSLLARDESAAFGVMGTIGVVLFVVGSVINTLSELLRDRWKQRSENRGRVYTEGLFRFAVHINYTGDVIWVLGLALIARSPWGIAIPAALFCFFAFYNVPILDRHLTEKYGDEFRDYASRTAKMVPGIW
jgi:protein-S-isoprenylcysteine O-methyltransferase Ste14